MSNDNRETVKKTIFRELSADDNDPEVTLVESLCMNCGENVSSLLFIRCKSTKSIIQKILRSRFT